MYKFRFILVFWVICTQCMYAIGKIRENKPLYSVAQLKEDFTFYLQVLEENHPNLYAYCTKVEFDNRTNDIKREIRQPMTALSFGLLIMELNSLLDGHSGPLFYDIERIDPDKMVAEQDTAYQYGYLPFMDVCDNKLYYKDEQVISINGRKSVEIIDYLNKRITAHDSYKRRDVIITHYLCARKFSYSLLKLVAPFTIKTKTERGKIHTYKENGWNKDDYQQLVKDIPSSPMESSLYTKDSIACLDFNTCNVEDYGDYRHWVDSIFNDVQSASIKYLFINVTWNEGGSYDLPYYVFDKLKHKAFYWDFSTHRKVSKLYCDARHLGSTYYKQNRGKIIRDDEPLFRKEVSSGYAGQVFVIQSPWTFSAANDFCLLIKNSGRGLLVGGRTGQKNQNITERHIFKLPHTQIEFGCAMVEYIHKDSNNNDGLCPDIPIDIGIYQAKFSLDDLKRMLELAKQYKH